MRVDFSFIYPENATAMNVEFKWAGTGDGDPGCVYVDDVEILEMGIPIYITNLGFEEDEAYDDWLDWYYWVHSPTNVGARVDVTQAHSGDKSFLLMTQDWDVWVVLTSVLLAIMMFIWILHIVLMIGIS